MRNLTFDSLKVVEMGQLRFSNGELKVIVRRSFQALKVYFKMYPLQLEMSCNGIVKVTCTIHHNVPIYNTFKLGLISQC